MKTHPLYENLDTSFTNLAALLRHLRECQFVGQVRVKLDGYTAEITLAAGNQMNVKDHDQIAGRIAKGDEALQSLLIRAREPGGAIDVYEFVEEGEVAAQKISGATEARVIEKPNVEKETLSSAPAVNRSGANEKISGAARSDDFLNLVPESYSPLPFEFANRVENRARRMQISAADWQTLLQLVGELFAAVDEVLNDANLDFSAMLENARTEISSDYPFLNPASGTFYYADGAAKMSEPASAKLFAASINEVLRRILARLAGDAHSEEIYRCTTQRILSVIYRRKSLCDEFFITPQLERIIGV